MRINDDEVEAFIAANSAVLMRSAVVLTGNPADAQDLVQRTCLTLWRSWGRVSTATQPLAYAHRMLVNEHLSERRRRHWHREQLTDRLPEPGQVDDRLIEDTAELRTLLAALPPRQRAAVVLRYVADLDDAAIAAALACSESTVRSQISRGLARLRTGPAKELRHER